MAAEIRARRQVIDALMVLLEDRIKEIGSLSTFDDVADITEVEWHPKKRKLSVVTYDHLGRVDMDISVR